MRSYEDVGECPGKAVSRILSLCCLPVCMRRAFSCTNNDWSDWSDWSDWRAYIELHRLRVEKLRSRQSRLSLSRLGESFQLVDSIVLVANGAVVFSMYSFLLAIFGQTWPLSGAKHANFLKSVLQTNCILFARLDTWNQRQQVMPWRHSQYCKGADR